LGDSTKAIKELGWKPKYDLKMLVKEMVESDFELARKEQTLKEHGYEILIPQEA
jgi:GDPmannose 4,6-dehydratase